MVKSLPRLLLNLAQWLLQHSWDWGAILFIVAGFWAMGYFVVGLALATPPPSAVEIAWGGAWLLIGTLMLSARIIYSAFASEELPSMFQRMVVTIFVLVGFFLLDALGFRYLSSKIPLLSLDASVLVFHPPVPPDDALTPNTQLPLPFVHKSYLTIDGVPVFAGSDPNGHEGSQFQAGDPLAFNLHYRATGPDAIYLGGAGMITFLEPDYNPETLKNAYKDFLRRVDEAKKRPSYQGETKWGLFTQGMTQFNTARAWEGPADHRTVHILTQSDLDNLKSGALVAVVIALFDYKDGGQVHHLWYCNYLQPPAQPPGIWAGFDACPSSD